MKKGFSTFKGFDYQWVRRLKGALSSPSVIGGQLVVLGQRGSIIDLQDIVFLILKLWDLKVWRPHCVKEMKYLPNLVTKRGRDPYLQWLTTRRWFLAFEIGWEGRDFSTLSHLPKWSWCTFFLFWWNSQFRIKTLSKSNQESTFRLCLARYTSNTPAKYQLRIPKLVVNYSRLSLHIMPLLLLLSLSLEIAWYIYI